MAATTLALVITQLWDAYRHASLITARAADAAGAAAIDARFGESGCLSAQTSGSGLAVLSHLAYQEVMSQPTIPQLSRFQ